MKRANRLGPAAEAAVHDRARRRRVRGVSPALRAGRCRGARRPDDRPGGWAAAVRTRLTPARSGRAQTDTGYSPAVSSSLLPPVLGQQVVEHVVDGDHADQPPSSSVTGSETRL